ncbi:MAG: adenylyl-sulfate kinase [Verrucomicrobiota bacterium]|jgi:adenylyl-sulfate kinase
MMNESKHISRNFADGCVVWLTGLSGAGKSTIARELKQRLSGLGRHAFILDGDSIRSGLCSDLSFSPPDRKENVRRISEVSRLFAEAGVICIVALISPYHADRHSARNIVGTGRFVEVYVNAPIEVCEHRDPKGLYAKARAGEIKEFTGVSAPYEPPTIPDIELWTNQLNVTESVGRILAYLFA